MAIVNFNITKPLEKKITQAIKARGFISKAEFFRFAAWRYLDNMNDTTQEELDEAVQELSFALQKKFKDKKLPSLREQIADLL